MSEIKTQPTKESVSKYISNIKSEERKNDCKILDKLMREISNKKPVMWGSSLVGYGRQKVKYSTGREIDWLSIGFSSRKDAISLYLTCDLNKFKNELKKLGKHKRGVGCLYIKKLSDIDIVVLKDIIKKAILIS